MKKFLFLLFSLVISYSYSQIEDPVSWTFSVEKIDIETYNLVIDADIENGWNVKIYDTFWYGDKHLPKSDRLTLYKGDVRDIENFKKTLSDVEYVLHLACK